MENGFAVTAFLALILNLILPAEIEDEETEVITANIEEEARDAEEWAHIRREDHHQLDEIHRPTKGDGEIQQSSKSVEAGRA